MLNPRRRLTKEAARATTFVLVHDDGGRRPLTDDVPLVT
jgi:hypothetical protein